METNVNLLCAGAAQGLVTQLAQRLASELSLRTQGRFGAVGAMQEAFDGNEPCDVFVSTQAMVDQMVADGRLLTSGWAPLGKVRTGVAVRRGDTRPDVATAATLTQALSSADAVYFPDPQRATAGIHFAKVMRALDLFDTLQPRFHTYPNGATAMRELAASTSPQPIGCTQVTEILYTPGVELVAVLPPEFELATTYTAAVSSRAQNPDAAARLIAWLSGPSTLMTRTQCGFEMA